VHLWMMAGFLNCQSGANRKYGMRHKGPQVSVTMGGMINSTFVLLLQVRYRPKFVVELCKTNMNCHIDSFEKRGLAPKRKRLKSSLPVNQSPFLTIFRFFLGSRARGRLQTHYATQCSDSVYQLQTYGIPTQVLPMDD
jgi:hypothetical protein